MGKLITAYLLSLTFSSSIVSAMETVRLQLKWLHQFQFAGYYAAVEKNYYADAGLQVELIEASPNRSPMQAVINGEAEYGVSTSDIVRLRSEGHPVVALAVIFQHSPLALISSQDAGIETIHDLSGKKIMMQDGSADLLSMLKEEGLPLDEIEFVPHSFSHQSLVNQEVQAISGYNTNEPYSLNLSGITPLIFSPQSVGIDFYGDALFTTEAQIQKNPAQVEAFRKASLRGWEYALDHPEEIIDLILSKYSKRKSKEELEFEAEKTISLVRADLVTLGHMNPKRWQHIASVLKDEGMLTDAIDINAMLYRHKAPFPIGPFLQVLLIALLCIALLSAFTYHQIKLKRQLQAEIERRKHGDETLLRREDEYRSLYHNAPLAFIVIDTELRIKEWNHEAEKLFGWKTGEVIGAIVSDFLVPDSATDKINQARAKLHKESHHSQINENYTKDGRVIWCKWHNVARKDAKGQTIEFHSIAVDVSDEISERAQLEKACSQALDASIAKDQLLAHTSHEIRNPLNAIMGFTQIIMDDSKDPETREMAKVILDGAEGMMAILNDLLDSAKIQAGKMEVQWTDVNLPEIVQKEAKLFSQLITNNGLSCQVNITGAIPHITSDARRIQQILNNLINNARKFTREGNILIEVKVDGTRHVLILVSDTGIGMTPETLQNAFEPYTQGPKETNRIFGGTGLGLSLTKKLTELLGGTLHAESELGKGSTFTLRLPLKPPTQAQS